MFRMTLGRRSRQLSLCIGLSLSPFLTPMGALEAQEPPAWTLPEALHKAFAESPLPRALRAGLDEVESRLLGARIYPYNPQLAFELADRSGSGTSSTDGGVSLSQELEVAGQRRKRIAVARQEPVEAEAASLRASRLLPFASSRPLPRRCVIVNCSPWSRSTSAWPGRSWIFRNGAWSGVPRPRSR